jgi:hypothetical protein
LDGRSVANPLIEQDGVLWLRKRANPTAQDHLELQVYRLITDAIPLTVTTRFALQVSGQPQEIVLGQALLTDFIPLALDSPLPARVESDGSLKAQVKPGTWVIEVRGRHPGPIDLLPLPEPSAGLRAGEEVWSFQAVNALRLVTVEGAPSLDPSQTNLPESWRQFPAYLMRPGNALRLNVRQRGDTDPTPDRLTLEKELWLDFDGGGYTMQDNLKGTISRSSRLETTPEIRLGRVEINGQDQFVTRLPDSTVAGVEVRQGSIELKGDSRLEGGAIGDLPAVGWRLEPISVRTVLNLPPGWRLVSASGADSVADAWLYQWNLLDIFIVLIIALSFGRLWGWGYGGLALAGMVLIYQEPNAPKLGWLGLLAAVALLRVLPPGRLHSLTIWFRRAVILVLLAIAVVFTVQQVRGALYPQLAASLIPQFALGASSPPAGSVSEVVPDEVSVIRRKSADGPAPAPLDYEQRYTSDLDVQTGPGLPTWRWRQAVFNWAGPVAAEQRIRLTLLPPWATRFLMIVGVGLMFAMLVRALVARSWRLSSSAATMMSLGLIPLLTGFAPEVRADMPTPSLLKELRARLTAPPDCQPQCAKLSNLRVQVSGNALRFEADLHSQVATAVPLPRPIGRLTPTAAGTADGPASLYRDREGHWWTRLAAGLNRLTLEFTVRQELAALQIALPMPPGRVALETRGWRAEGVYQGVAAGEIRLTRERTGDDGRLQPDVMPIFVEVERELVLGIDWEVRTRVRRISQADAAAVLAVPLMEGERVTTPGVRVSDGRVLLNLPPDQTETAWRSTLERKPSIILRAGEDKSFTETWRLRAEPLWHVEAAGIPVVHRHDDSGQWLPEWRPWPGEKLVLTVVRPEGVLGKTVTIDSATLRVKPGRRATETTLNLVVRSSRGREHTVTLPAGAELTRVTVDNESLPIEQADQNVVLPLTPGTQRIELAWRSDQGIVTWYELPMVNLGTDSVNSRLILELPRNRWPLFTGGPRLGPAVLFWGVLIVIALGAAALGRFGGTPLQGWQWFLLGLGLSQAHVLTIFLVVGWLLLLARRGRLGDTSSNLAFNGLQIMLVLLTLASLVSLIGAIEQGLLGAPSMQVSGNGSTAYRLEWYQDRSPGVLPQAWVVSAPLLVYRGLMLAWALWLALALLKWLGWGWGCLSSGGLWRRLRLKTG